MTSTEKHREKIQAAINVLSANAGKLFTAEALAGVLHVSRPTAQVLLRTVDLESKVWIVRKHVRRGKRGPLAMAYGWPT